MKATERAAKSSRWFGASRELHWHAIAAEWAYVIDGRCQMVVLDLSGASEINNYGPGDLWFFPKGHGHSIQTIGDLPCHFILSFDNGAFSEHGTFSITDWIDVTPKDMLALNFGVPKDAFDAFPKGDCSLAAKGSSFAVLPPIHRDRSGLMPRHGLGHGAALCRRSPANLAAAKMRSVRRAQ